MSVNRMTLRNTGHGDYRVNFLEARDDKAAYYTDCLEDAVLTGAAMRRRRDAKLRDAI
ncbi:hypothetical protein [Bradyrhizobium retamae]|nr:hypothetical protein [Bradyrhizobium retamae]